MPDETVPPVGWKVARGLAPALLFWIVLIGLLADSLNARTRWWRQADEANLTEWLTETRPFRKSLAELTHDYLDEYEKRRTSDGIEGDPEFKAKEIQEQLRALSDPTRAYQGQLPLFPEIYSLEVRFADPTVKPIRWDSPVPKPHQQEQSKVHGFTHNLLGKDAQGREDPRALLHCEYRTHVFAVIQRQNEEQTKTQWL